jgi:hypothetical protein
MPYTQLTALEDTLARTIQMNRHEPYSCVCAAPPWRRPATGAIVNDDAAIASEMDALFD